MSTIMRPEDRIQEMRSSLNVCVATANRDACLAVCIGLLDALDGHEIALVPVAPEPAKTADRSGARAFPARYRGRCDLCGGSVDLEDMIVMATPPRRGVDHARCAGVI